MPNCILAAIPEKLRKLTVCTQLTPPHTLSPALIQLNAVLDELLSDYSWDKVLLLPKKVVPNTGSWHKTEAIMGAKLKTKHKSAHTDAYSGGQASGKKAKKDARIPLEWMVIRYVAPLPPPSQTSYADNHPIPPLSNHIPYSPNTYGHPSCSRPVVSS